MTTDKQNHERVLTRMIINMMTSNQTPNAINAQVPTLAKLAAGRPVNTNTLRELKRTLEVDSVMHWEDVHELIQTIALIQQERGFNNAEGNE